MENLSVFQNATRLFNFLSQTELHKKYISQLTEKDTENILSKGCNVFGTDEGRLSSKLLDYLSENFKGKKISLLRYSDILQIVQDFIAKNTMEYEQYLYSK